ncbi:unnamed protein product [Notodromas monacha]|uniref:NF-X1-type domain-containing protein n=1 Tax=Notodromas monacha TaxID=399045 RepID=A0A7R9BWT4_9CRUS|nr:unnamed protein product [Notodromas monacha]CAG0923232.1 unnamed protein product [Notodromas monacha]
MFRPRMSGRKSNLSVSSDGRDFPPNVSSGSRHPAPAQGLSSRGQRATPYARNRLGSSHGSGECSKNFRSYGSSGGYNNRYTYRTRQPDLREEFDRKQGADNRRDFRQYRDREHPIGLRDLQRLAEGDDPAPIFAVINEMSGFPLALRDKRLKDHPERIKYILKVLRKAMDLHGFGVTVAKAISLALHSNLLDSLMHFNLTTLQQMHHSNPAEAQEFLLNEIVLFDVIVRLCPADEAMSIEACVNSIRTVVQGLENILEPHIDLISMYNQVCENLENLRKTVEEQDHSIRKAIFHSQSHLSEAPEDFRTLPILPTLKDLLGLEKPFLRANITRGRYLDANHYLDVQFRLMKEDFVRPLRSGVAEIMKGAEDNRNNHGAWRRIQEVRIYEKAVVIGKVYEPIGVTFKLKFSLRNLGRVRWEISKRLLFGSLVCLTNDNFKSVVFASVAERKVEDLKRGIVRIRPESSQFDMNAWTGGPEFLVVESAAFFEAYRHILTSLQNIPLEKYPLKKYIVDVENTVSLPKYILDHKPAKCIEDVNATASSPENSSDEDNPPQVVRQCVFPLTHKNKRFVGNPFSNQWPEPEELGLDEAQFRALKAGLCHEFALIQGPPGTGKTFIGLKLVETILARRMKLMIRNDGPILVVCYTNHALDQFLEGITRFTGKILRIGGRSKSTLLEPFSVRKAQLNCSGCASKVSRSVRSEMLSLGHSLSKLEILRKGITSGAGILSMGSLHSFGIAIPECFPLHFSLADWLGFTRHSMNSSGKFLKQILEEEKKLLLAEHKTSKFPNESDENIIDHVGNGVMDAVDMDIEDETAIEAQRRHIESIYDDDCPAAVTTDEEANECIRYHFEITSTNCGRAVKDAEDLRNNIVHRLKDKTKCFENREDLSRQLIQAELRLEGLKLMSAKVQADSAFLKVPANLDLVKPPEELVGPEEKWVNVHLLKARWLIYRYWANLLIRALNEKIDTETEKYKELVGRYKEAQDGALLQHMQSLDVVGMTTTGAARNISLVQNMKAKILVVEEAAEVLESHIVCCLSPHCQHIILIGDHQQLKPSTTVFQLAKKFGLDVSLFERMLKNRVPFERLRLQHRMRPEISNLIKFNIYEDLQDHESVSSYDDILGVDKNVFFVSHNIPEESNEDLKSKSNEVEAKFLLALCRYLLLQGYKHEQITILTGYSGQLFVFKKLLANFPSHKTVRITLVDNYQGEENDIILLSLVRSNLEGNIGFLRTDNRVNVALSRAKKGLFIVGNMDALSSASELWRKMKCVLEKENQIGSALPLRCQIHPDQVISVFNPDDFPLGGGCSKAKCSTKCFTRLDCGHACERNCHATDDPEHMMYKCSKPCGKSCPKEHPCTDKCYKNPCPPCRELVDMTLTCGHSLEVPCYVKPEDVKCRERCAKTLPCGHMCRKTCKEPCGDCRVKVEKKIPDCSHSVKLNCSEVPEKSDCLMKCEKMLPCGHRCPYSCRNVCTTRCLVLLDAGKVGRCGHRVKLPCHIKNSGNILSDEDEMEHCDHPCGEILSCGHECVGTCSKCLQGRIHVPCGKPCGRQLVCGHVCKVACSLNCPPCKEKCENSCPHSACRKRCGEPCVPCLLNSSASAERLKEIYTCTVAPVEFVLEEIVLGRIRPGDLVEMGLGTIRPRGGRRGYWRGYSRE